MKKTGVNLKYWTLVFVLMDILSYFNMSFEFVIAFSWIVRYALMFQLMNLMIRSDVSEVKKKQGVIIGAVVLFLSVITKSVYEVFFSEYGPSIVSQLKNPVYVIAYIQFVMVLWWYLKNRRKLLTNRG